MIEIRFTTGCSVLEWWIPRFSRMIPNRTVTNREYIFSVVRRHFLKNVVTRWASTVGRIAAGLETAVTGV